MRVLETVARLHYMPLDQLVKALFYAPSSYEWVWKTVYPLYEHGYLRRQILARETQAGSSPYIYRLDKNGFVEVKALEEHYGLLLPKKWREPDGPASSQQLPHDLAVNEVLIAALRLANEHPDFALTHLYHDRSLKRWIRVQLPDGKTVALDPDGYVEFIYKERWQLSLLFEVDRDHHNQQCWREKIRKHVAYIRSGAHPKLFGAPKLTIPCFVEADSTSRVGLLKQWTEIELQELGVQRFASSFPFAHFQPKAASTEQLFHVPVWSIPFQDEAVSLVAAPEAEIPTSARFQVVQAA